MPTYYYSYRQVEGGWDKQPQYFITFGSWTQFVEFCYTLSFHLQKEIRACESKGYDNQGSYFLRRDDCMRVYSVQELVDIYKSDPNCSPELWISSENLSDIDKNKFLDLVKNDD